MEVVVDDTNILIDLANTGLIGRCQELDISFRTTDMVIGELRNNTQREAVNKYIEDGGLIVSNILNNDLIEVTLTYQQLASSTNLSPADVSVMLLARNLGCRLLTNDQKLKRQAESRGIEANGILWLTDQMIERKIIAPIEMIDYLQTLLATNERAPRQLIMERIQEYTKTIKGISSNGNILS